MSDRLYFRQLLAGVDFAVDDPLAKAMRNFTYVIGDRETGEAILVDPAYRPDELLELLTAEGLSLVGAVATHYHPDHVGGSLMGHQHVEGVRELLDLVDVPVHAQRAEVERLVARAGVSGDQLAAHADGDVLAVGSLEVTLRHTPGHTPGSQCLVVEGRLVSGDTLFIDGCGRTDLPGGDARDLYVTLQERLANVPDDTVLFPGHLYSPESSLAMGAVRARNQVLWPRSLEAWLAVFGS